VEQSLSAAQLTGWTVRDAGGDSAGAPCASLALDSDPRVATIAPVGR
jgi:hypothetical protein